MPDAPKDESKFGYTKGDVEFLSPMEVDRLRPKGMRRNPTKRAGQASWWRPTRALTDAEERASGGNPPKPE